MANHRVELTWMGERVVTLADLLRPQLRAVCVGINPSIVSVEAGHYYQGRAGQRFLARLCAAGLIGDADRGTEDDAAFASGVGFTDIVKRPTSSAKELRAEEYRHGRELLREKLAQVRPRLAIFTYKTAAQAMFGTFAGNGFVPGLAVADVPVFVMPGPNESKETAEPTLASLAQAVRGFGVFNGLYEPSYLDRLRACERA
ncbi:MAG: mismatch-specific DNA-glycosylase [Conexibacter sp.]